ncbi:Tetraspanin family [Popillia japonica]|uniref:Tetraspanin n=1 Tax=Popillia japonica TaxID=7064 RepID=A0AAW1IZJ6_POPJA
MGFFADIWKAILLIINTIFLLLGCGLTGLGIWATVKSSSASEKIEELDDFTETYRDLILVIVGKILIIFGPVITIIAFTGFWGIVAQKKWMLKLYAVVLILIVILQTAIGIYYICTVRFEKKDFEPQTPGVANRHTEFLDSTQRTLQCCGYYEPSEMRTAMGAYPASCCKDSALFGTLRYSDNTAVDPVQCEPHETGCWYQYTSYLKTAGTIYGGFVGFEVVCIVAAFIVVRSFTIRQLSYNRVS